jgi:hypothetical protein
MSTQVITISGVTGGSPPLSFFICDENGDTNGCIHDEIQDCLPTPCSCSEYMVVWNSPSIVTFSYDPCCPGGPTVTDTVFWPSGYVFSASSVPNIIVGSPKVVEIIKKNDLCPC